MNRKYPKISTIWKRDPNNRNKIVEEEYSMAEFPNVRKWHITEKIDGTNIRVFYNEKTITFAGRTDEAEIPKFLLARLHEMFTLEKMALCFPPTPVIVSPNNIIAVEPDIILFGEGFGNKIQKVGEKYDPLQTGFVLFDVWINGLWLTRENVEDIAAKLNIPVVPTIGVMTIEEAIAYLKTTPQSKFTTTALTMEGIVARSEPLMLTRRGEPLMWKLKLKDYRELGM